MYWTARFVEAESQEELEQISRPAIDVLEKTLEGFNRRIEKILSEDIKLSGQAKIVISIPGFGKIIASKIIIAPHGFTRLTDPRALACYAGIAPFEHRSGTSLKGKIKVSHLANNDLKK